ncbi:MAG: hydrogenase [Chloroflexi bacterium CG_4_9_14_3_um_filter_45_9]|nr:MAG: hydrogenase [Chloroflexi bacterium CG_4_9_14_3_um_filter_45_9]
MNKNIYTPDLAVIKKVCDEAKGIKTFTLEFQKPDIKESFDYRPGQFVELTIFGVGEAPISITSSPVNKGYLELSVAAVGKVTQALHLKKEGEVVGLRGPYGNGFPLNEVKGKNTLFVGGGIGLAPLRSLINQIFAQRGDFAKISILYGARNPDLLCFMNDLERWSKVENSEILLTVDVPDARWKDNVGVVGSLLPKIDIDIENTVAFVCGPPIMIHFVILDLLRMGFRENKIITTMERRMECGLGKCGHCNIGKSYVCLDGPVFSFQQLRELGENI